MGAVLALASAILYGIVDFAGGKLSRRIDGFTLALPVQAAGLVVMLTLAFLLQGGPNGHSLAWGALSGVGSGIAIMFLYRAMGAGQISLVVPLTAVIGAALPAMLGLLLGERPGALALVGLTAVLPAVWLIAQQRPTLPTPMKGGHAAVIAGCGVALQYAAIAQADPSAGLWPMAANRLASIVVVYAGIRAAGVPAWPGPHYIWPAAWLGALASLSLALYLFATRLSFMSVAVTLASLYPVVPVILGVTVLHERLNRLQWLGVAIAAGAVMLIMSESH
ncbi:DMT family transporter [Pusillimonas sp. SM2304]|uniref:DMT family transporter n=1 Tax=Pusillimonas sp. SM2304 TaxID=3073241 RepID=UPI0028742492|nr:DMT family transporter [Pusillimonas sp. SM2304]MDS1138930.1 DMT family transporter [Pusillimonas sp. SM2304]